MTRVLVVRLGSLGDLIHTLPAVAAIGRAHPNVEIDWLVDAVHADLLAMVPGVARVVTVRERSASGWLAARRALRERQYDVALDFQGLLKSAVLARLSGARQVLGFSRAGLREPAASIFYSSGVPGGEGVHVIHKNLQLAAAVGAATDRLTFPLEAGDSAARSFLADRGVTPYALVNPGAAWPNKCWPPDRFGVVARHLRERHRLTPVVLWGPNEQARADRVAAASDGAALVAPETSLGDLVSLCHGASFMVSGDTGPIHIAGAMAVPIVALFGPTDAGRNGPWHPDDIALSRYDSCACHYERQCRRPDADWCLGTITTEAVIEAIDRRLSAAPPDNPEGR